VSPMYPVHCVTHVSGPDQEGVAHPGGFELPTFWFVAVRSTLPNLARGVANRANSASWNKSPQTNFSFICRHLLHISRYFPQFA